VRSILGLLAIVYGARMYGRLLVEFTEDELITLREGGCARRFDLIDRIDFIDDERRGGCRVSDGMGAADAMEGGCDVGVFGMWGCCRLAEG
jgi:hypothetical protein